MSKGFAIALVAALVLVPCTAVMSIAEELQAEVKQDCCDKGKGCCDKKTACDKDCKSIAGKCTDCKTADCDIENCADEGCEKSACKCTAAACAKCDASGCRRGAIGYAGCNSGDCASGTCRSKSSYDIATNCAGSGRCACQEQSALRLYGPSLLDIALPSSASSVTDEMWRLVADELDAIGQHGRCELRADQFTLPTPAIASTCEKSVFLVLGSETGGDYAIECECTEDTSVSSVLESAILPHPINFAAAEIAVHRARQVVEDGVVEIEESILPVRWDRATGEPTKCTNHALQARDRVCVKLPAVRDSAFDAAVEAYAPESRGNIVERRIQPVAECESATQIQYSIQIIEDCRGCMAEYEPLRRGVPMMCAESKTLLPAMRMLNKHQLIRQLSSPKLTCVAGQTAQLQIGSESPVEDSDEWEGVRLAVASEETENGLMVELAVHASEAERDYERRMALVIQPGQTIVLNANAAPAVQDEPKQHEPAVYIVVTPEIVK